MRTYNAKLAALLVESGWSRGEFARAVNAQATVYGLVLRYDRTSVAHWLSGSRPRAPIPEFAAQVLSRRCHRVVSALETGLAQSRDESSISSLQTPNYDELVSLLRAVCRDDVDPARRPILVRSAYVLSTVTLLEWQSAHVDGAARVNQDPHGEVARLQNMTRIIDQLYSGYGGRHARIAVAAYVANDMGGLLATARPSAERRLVLSSGAQLTHQLAVMTVDAGHHGLAQRYFQMSLSLAREGDNSSLYAITLRTMSQQALALGHVRHAVDLAEAAVVTGDRSDSPVRAYLLAQAALARAADQQASSAAALLDQAWEEHQRSPGAPGPFTSYPRAALDFQRARTLRKLGRTSEALSALQDSLRHRPPTQRRAYALTQAETAELLFAIGRIERACDYWSRFLNAYPELQSASADRARESLIRALACVPQLERAVRVRRRALSLSQFAVRG
ncbi:tol-pal system YbgF family protein [Streptomyces wedmorensis]|uniref:tol-pal system YbgF family protein n=1 Tax=Streptomyces wedmorensis TaxID=43759 RepID=UPI00379DCACF